MNAEALRRRIAVCDQITALETTCDGERQAAGFMAARLRGLLAAAPDGGPRTREPWFKGSKYDPV